jgi:hypothetical protein
VSFAALAFNVKGKDAKRRNPVPFAFGLAGYNIIVRNVNLNLWESTIKKKKNTIG